MHKNMHIFVKGRKKRDGNEHENSLALFFLVFKDFFSSFFSCDNEIKTFEFYDRTEICTEHI